MLFLESHHIDKINWILLVVLKWFYEPRVVLPGSWFFSTSND